MVDISKLVIDFLNNIQKIKEIEECIVEYNLYCREKYRDYNIFIEIRKLLSYKYPLITIRVEKNSKSLLEVRRPATKNMNKIRRWELSTPIDYDSEEIIELLKDEGFRDAIEKAIYKAIMTSL